MSMVRWTCGFILKDKKKYGTLRELLGLESESVSVRQGSVDMAVWTC